MGISPGSFLSIYLDSGQNRSAVRLVLHGALGSLMASYDVASRRIPNSLI